MSFFLGSDEVPSDSDYESAKSQLSTPLESPPLDSNGNPIRSTGKNKTKKKLRRGTGLPAFKFPRGLDDDDVEKMEDDELATKTEVEVSVQNLMSTAKTHRDLLLQELRRDTHLQPGLAIPAASTFIAKSSSQQKSPAPELKQKPSSSIALAFRPKPVPNKPDQEKKNHGDQLHPLQQSLTQIRTHLATLESAISANITAQLVTLTGSPDPDVADTCSLPSFQAERKQKESVGAILGTVKVVCAVERGLEALVGTLALAEGEDGDGKKELMDACLENPEEVALEMQKAIVGMRRVLKSIPVKH